VTERPDWVPSDVDVNLPSAARVYDFLLGGAHNFPADRAVGQKVLQVLPNGGAIAGSNRAFLRRAVLYMIEQGINQFLDLGSGIPTVGNVHEVAQEADPSARVVYVDYESVAVAHSELILSGNDNATVFKADMCEPETILEAPETRRLINFDEPIGLLMVAVLHFVPDERKPGEILARYHDALPAGSLLGLSHLTADHAPAEMSTVVEAMKHSRDPMYFRPYDEIVAMFDEFELVEPGVVSAPRWHPEPGLQDVGPSDIYGGVARKV